MFKITWFPIFVKLLKHVIFIRRFLEIWMHDDKNIHLHLEAGVITWRLCNDFYFLFNTLKYILCTMYAYFAYFSCPNGTKMANITRPVSMATRFKSNVWYRFLTFCTKRHTLCKFHQNRRLSISTYIGNS